MSGSAAPSDDSSSKSAPAAHQADASGCESKGPAPSAGRAGASPYGNFHQYYEFNAVEERLSNLPAHVHVSEAAAAPLSLLDVGCNEGDLTVALLKRLCGGGGGGDGGLDLSLAVGVDIDPVLVERARSKHSRGDGAVIHFVCGDVMDADVRRGVLELLHEYVECARFSLVCLWSVTMWIHVHHGDAGLRALLDWACAVGDNVFVEPQAWKSYKSCRRRWRRLKKEREFNVDWDGITIRDPDAFVVRYAVEEHNFEVVREFEQTKWGRKTVWLRRTRRKQEV